MSTAKQKKKKREEQRPFRIVMSTTGTVWDLVDSDVANERMIIQGREVSVRVDVREYCYRMKCSCGRARYAKRNSVHQITKCRVCQRRDEKKRKRKKKEG